MFKDGQYYEEAKTLYSATAHWLRYFKHISDDVGHAA